MEHTIKVNINEVIDLHTDDDKIELIKSIMYNLYDEKRDQFIKYLLNDLLEAEIEFDGRPAIIGAYRILIDNKL
jgi:hypothetical protein